jgi:hypothetical protein
MVACSARQGETGQAQPGRVKFGSAEPGAGRIRPAKSVPAQSVQVAASAQRFDVVNMYPVAPADSAARAANYLAIFDDVSAQCDVTHRDLVAKRYVFQRDYCRASVFSRQWQRVSGAHADQRGRDVVGGVQKYKGITHQQGPLRWG